jgi:hypothetical protein
MCLQTRKIIRKFKSVTEAAQLVGVSISRMSTSVTRFDGIKSCAGFGWRFTDFKKEASKRKHKKWHLQDDADATRNGHPQKRIQVVVGGEIYIELSNLVAEFAQAISAPRKVAYDGSNSMLEDTYSESSKVACDSGNENKFDIPPDDHSPDDCLDDNSILGDETMDESSDYDSVFTVEGESNAHISVCPSTSPRPPTSTNSSRGRQGMKIEQVCLQTGKLLQRFNSISEAAKLTGFVYFQIRESIGQVFNGFFWRLEGSTALPTHLENPANGLLCTTHKYPHTAHLVETSTHFTSSPSVVPIPPVSASGGNPVEKYCVKTGRLLARFGSIIEAARSVGIAPANIMAVVSSLNASKLCMGFGSRCAASAEPPPEASDGPVPAVSANAIVVPSHVAGGASVGTYSPRQEDRFRVYFDKVSGA